MLTRRLITEHLENWAPPSLAESYDNVGYLTGAASAACTGVLVSLDCTEAVVAEAREKGANLIVSHHPIWFSARKELRPDDYVARTLLAAIQQDIALYAIHTNLDNVATGVNAALANLLELQETRVLQPHAQNAAPLNSTSALGAGRLGRLPKPLLVRDFLQHLKETLHTPVVRYTHTDHRKIEWVAVCGGSGSFLIPAARAAGAHALVTGDITYHTFFDGEERLLLADVGHYESEACVPTHIAAYLREMLPNFAVHLSEIRTNPVAYY